MPSGDFQLDLFLWQSCAQPVAAQVVSEMQMFKVFAAASQRKSTDREENWTVEFWRRTPWAQST